MTGLDPINLTLLRELAQEPRLSTAELSRRAGTSALAVSARVARLEETGDIRGYGQTTSGFPPVPPRPLPLVAPPDRP